MLNNNLLVSVCVGLIVLVIVLLLGIRMLKKRQEAIISKRTSGTGRLAESLRDERLKSEIILKGIDDGVVLIDNEQIIQAFNPGAATITGWGETEAKDLSWSSVIKFVSSTGEEVDDSSNPLKRVFEQATVVHDNNANVQSKSDKMLAVSVTASPLLDDRGDVSGVVAVLRDVSQQRKEEAQRADFISTASHEMRTPVAAIEGYLALALNEKVSTIDTRARDYLNKAHASTQHLGSLFQDLLTSAKAEDGRLSNHPAIVEIGQMLEQLTEDLKFSAQKKGLFIKFTIGTTDTTQTTIDASGTKQSNKVIRPLYYTWADPERLREVIINLFDNAVKYTDTGRVTIGLTGNNEVVQFYIRDTGHGIPADDVPHLFQKFYRVDNSATRTIGGTGLGLFICRKIVELYNGRIWVESKIDEGSTFYINLPRVSTQKAEQIKAQVAAGTAVETSPVSTPP